MRAVRRMVLGLILGVASGAGSRRRRAAWLIALPAVLLLLPLLAACGGLTLSYIFVDDEQRTYRLSMAVTEQGPDGQTLGTIALDALLRVGVNIDTRAASACYATVDYEDVKMSATGSAESSVGKIPTAYFPLCQGRLLAFAGPIPRGQTYSLELAKTGPNGSLTAMLLNTFVCKCFAQPLRDSSHGLKAGNEWTTVQKLPGEFLTYLYTGKRPAAGQNKETTHVRVARLLGEGGFAELTWWSVAQLQGSRPVDLSERLAQMGVDPSDIAALTPDQLKGTVAIAGSCSCSGAALVRTSDGWPEQASVDFMTLGLTYLWSANGPSADILTAEEAGPAELILEITGSIEAAS